MRDSVLSLSTRRAWIEMSTTSPDRCPSLSLSTRRAWIEMYDDGVIFRRVQQSLSTRRAWIEIALCGGIEVVSESLSTRRAWIEMISVTSFSAVSICRIKSV